MGWTQDVGYVGPRLIEALEQYRGERVSVKLYLPCTLPENVRIGQEFLSASVALRARLEQAIYREREAYEACATNGAKLVRANAGADELVEFRKR